MRNKKTDKASPMVTAKPNKSVKISAKFDIKQHLLEELDIINISKQETDFAIGIFLGHDALSLVRELYPDIEDSLEQKRFARKLVCSRKMKKLIRAIKLTYVDGLSISSNTLLNRLEMLYSEAVEDGNSVMALQIIREMNNVIKAANIVNVEGDVQFILPDYKPKETHGRVAEIKRTNHGIGVMEREMENDAFAPIVIIEEDEDE